MGEVTACGICGSRDLRAILDMGEQPLAERYDSDRRYPLALMECQDCTLVQLSYIVDQREVFPPDHAYATGNTGALRQHFAALAHKLTGLLSPGDLVVDIGANDGTLISEFSGGLRRVAVEPTRQARKIGDSIAVYEDFFTAGLAATIRKMWGPAKVVTACNVLAHVPDPHNFTEGVKSLLADDGVFVAEVHDLASVVDGLQYDACYHEHLYYYNRTSLSRLLGMHGFTVAETERIPTHGGSMRVFARKGHTSTLAKRASESAEGLRRMLADIAGQGQVIYGIGATTRATPLIHYAKIAPYVAKICEISGSEKIGYLMPATQIPVVDEVALLEDKPEFAILFSWHIADSIMPKFRNAGYHGKFIIPLPEPGLVND